MQITRYLYLFFLYSITLLSVPTIMIDPAGDTRTPGRTVGDSFERAITYQLALDIKKQLEADNAYAVIITRSPGQTVVPLQNANFANRLHPDLYVSLHCYDDQDKKFSISLYTMSRAEPFITPLPELCLLPLNKAHWPTIDTTKKIAITLQQALAHAYSHQFLISTVAAIPCASLIGIQAPAISIELNCHNTSYSNQYIKPLVHALTTALPS